ARRRAARESGVDWPPHGLVEARRLGRGGTRPGVARLPFPVRIARGAAEIVLGRATEIALCSTPQVLVMVELIEVVVVVDVDVHVTVDVHVVVGVAITWRSYVAGRRPECRSVDRVVHISWRVKGSRPHVNRARAPMGITVVIVVDGAADQHPDAKG